MNSQGQDHDNPADERADHRNTGVAPARRDQHPVAAGISVCAFQDGIRDDAVAKQQQYRADESGDVWMRVFVP